MIKRRVTRTEIHPFHASCNDLSCGGGGESSSTVNPYGAAVLTWNAPEQNMDGAPLTDLAG